MSINISWYMENRILFIKVPQEVSIEEIKYMSSQISDAIQVGEAPIHVIFDASEMQTFPNNVKSLMQAMQIFLKHPKMGWNFAINPNRLILFLGTVVSRALGMNKYRAVASVDEALEILYRVDSTLA